MDEGTSFWGHKGLQRRFGKVNGRSQKGWTVEGGYKNTSELQ